MCRAGDGDGTEGSLCTEEVLVGTRGVHWARLVGRPVLKARPWPEKVLVLLRGISQSWEAAPTETSGGSAVRPASSVLIQTREVRVLAGPFCE